MHATCRPEVPRTGSEKGILTFPHSPKHVLIVEDSPIGKEAALLSCAHLCAVTDPEDLTLAKVLGSIKVAEASNAGPSVKALTKNLTVVIPMAGLGSRFANVGYTFPKPLIEVRTKRMAEEGKAGKPMIQVVVENLAIEGATFVYIVQKSHREKYGLDYLLNAITPGCKIVETEGVTQGSTCSVLLAKKYIDTDGPLLLANSDQLVEWDSARFFHQVRASRSR